MVSGLWRSTRIFAYQYEIPFTILHNPFRSTHMRKIFLLLLLLLGSDFVQAQQRRSTGARPAAGSGQVSNLAQAQRFTKLGNTLREAKQYDEALAYLEKALKSAQTARDRFWSGAAYENMAFVYRDRNDVQNASYYFGKAIESFSSINSAASVKALQQMLDGLKDKMEVYGGIEIGAKGIKLSLIGVKFGADGRLLFRNIKSEDINASPMSCSENAFRESAKAVRTFLDTLLINRQLPRDRVFVVASSGLKQELDKCGKADQLIQMVKAEIGGVYYANVDYITPCTEAELVIRGTIPSRLWNSTTMVDIGSGNTKGGYYSGNSFECIDFYGTGAFTKLIQSNLKGRPFAEAAKAVLAEDAVPLIASEIGRKPGFQNRDLINFSGGIVYALTTYLYPEKINDTEVPFSYNDAKLFLKMAVEDYSKLTNPDMSRIDSEETYKFAQSEAKKIREKIFTQEQIIGGASLIVSIMDEIRKTNPQNKKYVFQREGKIGWIGGYIVRSIAQGYQDTKEE
jgi:tetratricopeptide (TPR) repeat protein